MQIRLLLLVLTYGVNRESGFNGKWQYLSLCLQRLVPAGEFGPPDAGSRSQGAGLRKDAYYGEGGFNGGPGDPQEAGGVTDRDGHLGECGGILMVVHVEPLRSRLMPGSSGNVQLPEEFPCCGLRGFRGLGEVKYWQ